MQSINSLIFKLGVISLLIFYTNVLFASSRHTVTFNDRANNYFEVESEFSVPSGQKQIELVMAGWTPGSYLVRDYARHVENFEVDTIAGPQAARVEKIAKNRWRITGNHNGRVIVNYRVYAREMTVRTNWVESDFAYLNGAPTFMRPVGPNGESRDDEPHTVQINLPKGWKNSVTSMDKMRRNNVYKAENWDELVDSPIVAGNLGIHKINVDTKHPHYLVQVGDTEYWDAEKATDAVAKVVDSQQKMWGTDPFDKPYYFLNLVVEARGGLEHKHSTSLMHRRFTMQDRDSWVNWMNLVAHEYFHSWNIKRLRPKTLGPFNYDAENYTSELWFVEGFTSYYANVLNYRAGLITKSEFFKNISRTLQSLSTTAGQTTRSVSDASFDAWIRGYRPDENSTNANVSYYGKGAMVALKLDAQIREKTNGQKSLDDLMRIASEKYSGEIGFVNADIYRLADELADSGDWLRDIVETADYIDVSNAIDYFGLDLKTREKTPEEKKVEEAKKEAKKNAEKDSGDSDEKKEKEPEVYDKEEFKPAYLGFNFNSDTKNLIVSQVKKESPVYKLGINVNDELLAIDNIRVNKANFSKRMSALSPEQNVELLMARRGRLYTVSAKTISKPLKSWTLKVSKDATDEQKERLENWLN